MIHQGSRLLAWSAWLLAIDAALYALLYGALGAAFPAFGDNQIASLAHLSPDLFRVDPLHAVWLREVVSISLTRLVLALIVLIVALGAIRTGQHWAYLVSLLYGALLLREVFNELQIGVTLIFWTGVFVAALWALSGVLGLAAARRQKSLAALAGRRQKVHLGR